MSRLDAPAIPILPSADFDRTAGFYELLGFDELARWDDYLIVSRDQVELHFFGGGSHAPGGCYLRISDAPGLHAEWSLVGEATVHPLVETDYGLIEFALHDPDGNQLRVGSPA